MASQPTPPGPRTPPRNKGLIAGLIKGNQWVFISPDHKPGYFWGGFPVTGGGWLTIVMIVGVPWTRFSRHIGVIQGPGWDPCCQCDIHPGRLTAGTCPHGGLVPIIFLSFHGWFVCSMLIFQSVIPVKPYVTPVILGVTRDESTYPTVNGGHYCSVVLLCVPSKLQGIMKREWLWIDWICWYHVFVSGNFVTWCIGGVGFSFNHQLASAWGFVSWF